MATPIVRVEDVVLHFPPTKPTQIRPEPLHHFCFIHIDEHKKIIASKKANYGLAVLLSFFLGFGMAFLVRVCR